MNECTVPSSPVGSPPPEASTSEDEVPDRAVSVRRGCRKRRAAAEFSPGASKKFRLKDIASSDDDDDDNADDKVIDDDNSDFSSGDNQKTDQSARKNMAGMVVTQEEDLCAKTTESMTKSTMPDDSSDDNSHANESSPKSKDDDDDEELSTNKMTTTTTRAAVTSERALGAAFDTVQAQSSLEAPNATLPRDNTIAAATPTDSPEKVATATSSATTSRDGEAEKDRIKRCRAELQSLLTLRSNGNHHADDPICQKIQSQIDKLDESLFEILAASFM